MPRHPKRSRLLPSSVVAIALGVLLYFVIPPLRSLSALELAGCFLVTFFVVSRLRRAFRPRPETSPESAELRELLRQFDRMMSAEDCSPRSRQARAKAGGT